MTKKKMIHESVEMKPKYTSFSSKPQPRVNIHRNAVVACVNGKQYEIYLQVEMELMSSSRSPQVEWK